MSESNVERVIVTVTDQHRAAIQAVAQALQAIGLKGTNVLATAGIITGEIAAAKRAQLSSVDGVAAVESDQEMQAI